MRQTRGPIQPLQASPLQPARRPRGIPRGKVERAPAGLEPRHTRQGVAVAHAKRLLARAAQADPHHLGAGRADALNDGGLLRFRKIAVLGPGDDQPRRRRPQALGDRLDHLGARAQQIKARADRGTGPCRIPDEVGGRDALARPRSSVSEAARPHRAHAIRMHHVGGGHQRRKIGIGGRPGRGLAIEGEHQPRLPRRLAGANALDVANHALRELGAAIRLDALHATDPHIAFTGAHECDPPSSRGPVGTASPIEPLEEGAASRQASTARRANA